MGTLLRRGVAAGSLGGIAAALCLLLLGESSIRDAIAIEEAAGGGGDAMFSRNEQVVGGILGLVVFGLLVGLVFAVVFARTRHRLPGRDDFARSLAVGTAGFVAVVLIPALKYPANPPAVGDPDTVGSRTSAYLGMIVIGIVVVAGAGALNAYLRSVRAWPQPARWSAVAGGVAVALSLAWALLPANPDPIEVPATLIWRFRLASLAAQAALWATLALAFGWLCVGRDGLPQRTAPATAASA